MLPSILDVKNIVVKPSETLTSIEYQESLENKVAQVLGDITFDSGVFDHSTKVQAASYLFSSSL